MDRFEEIITQYHVVKRTNNPIITIEQVEDIVGLTHQIRPTQHIINLGKQRYPIIKDFI